jgi:nucleotide-binding universal stress UspA family protein
MKKIVVGYDGTEPSQRALERTAELAKAFGSEVIVASVAPIIAGVGRSAGPADPVDSLSKHNEELARAKDFLDGRAVGAEYLAGVGEPADAVAELAEERGADLIVVGTREIGHVQRLLGQSVSESVSHKVHCDVLIVHLQS